MQISLDESKHVLQDTNKAVQVKLYVIGMPLKTQ